MQSIVVFFGSINVYVSKEGDEDKVAIEISCEFEFEDALVVLI